MEVKEIKLSEIDCDVIPSIRPINKIVLRTRN